MAKKYKQVMAEIEKQRIYSKIQLIVMEKRKKLVLLLDNQKNND